MTRYELNVSIGGVHYCRMALPDTTAQGAVTKSRAIANRFGIKFDFDLTRWDDTGTPIALWSPVKVKS